MTSGLAGLPLTFRILLVGIYFALLHPAEDFSKFSYGEKSHEPEGTITPETVAVNKVSDYATYSECDGREDNDSFLVDSGPQYCNARKHVETNSGTVSKDEEFLKKIEEAEAEYRKSRESSRLKRQNLSCDIYMTVIEEDLKRFKNGITKDAVELARKRGVFYQIRNKMVYRQSGCNFPSRCAGIQHFLLKIAPSLPDMELVINVSDWPQTPADPGPWVGVPVFSFSKNGDYGDILYPAWTFWEGGPAISVYPRGIGRWDLMRKKLISEAEANPWKSKKSTGFFRGSRTSSKRDPLVLLSRKVPELLDAKYTKNQAWKSEADTLYEAPAAEVPMEEHCFYKYLFNFRGVAASFRYKHLFLCRSLVFHSDDGWIEFFYPMLKPWIHYVPLSSVVTEEEIRSLLEFFNRHDDVAEKIASRGYKFIKSRLKMKDIECYWKELLESYGRLIQYEVTPRDDLILVQ